MVQVYLALGSNVGDSKKLIDDAIILLSAALSDIVRASFYTSKAVGYTDQPDFLNTAIRGETDLSPLDLLKFVKDIEQQVGRVYRFRWGPREVDIDIIFYDNLIMNTPILSIPHPRFAERDFVLRPIIDIDANVVDPVSHMSLIEILKALPVTDLAVYDNK